MTEWISVKDRLPNKDNKIIVCLINNTPILAIIHDATVLFTGGKVTFYWPTQEWIKDNYYGQITHWMPLPELPK